MRPPCATCHVLLRHVAMCLYMVACRTLLLGSGPGGGAGGSSGDSGAAGGGGAEGGGEGGGEGADGGLVGRLAALLSGLEAELVGWEGVAKTHQAPSRLVQWASLSPQSSQT